MRIPLIQLDAFTDRVFSGNPAAVCPLDSWLPDETLLAIARENNLSETAFFVPSEKADVDYDLRWFTPAVEVELCGHATLAAGKVIFTHLAHEGDRIVFDSLSGPLVVSRGQDDLLKLDFPAMAPVSAVSPRGLAADMGAKPDKVLKSARNWWLLVYPDEQAVAQLTPDFGALKKRGLQGYLATAPGTDCDFVSRCFFPAYGIDEDPVTGSAHCILGPYWHDRLGKDTLVARQISHRGGHLWLTAEGDRQGIAGHAVEVITGEMLVA